MLVCGHARLGDEKVVYDPELSLGNAVVGSERGDELQEPEPLGDLLMVRVGATVYVDLLPIPGSAGGGLLLQVRGGGLAVGSKIPEEPPDQVFLREEGAEHSL